MKYHIVEFVDEKTVEVVPDAWLAASGGNKCFWPPGPGNKASFAKKGRSPAKGWKKFNTCIKGTYSNYDDARRKLHLSQFTSDLESEDAEKRKTSRPARYAIEAHTGPPPPPPPSSFPAGTSASTSIQRPSPPDSSEDSRPMSDIEFSEQSSGNVLEASGEVSDAGVDPAEKEDAELCKTQSQKNLQRKLLPAEEFQYQVLTRLTVLRMVQQQHGELLTSLAEKVSRQQPLREQPPKLLNSPFRDYESLKRFDATLTGSAKEAFIQELAGMGGANATVCTRRLLKALMTDDLAREFSWFGKKGKHAFSQLRVASCIVSAVKSTHDATDYSIEASIREWLRHAPGRHSAASRKAQAAQ